MEEEAKESQYYVDFNQEGKISGFYFNEIHGDNIPVSALPISEEEWQTYSADSNLYKLDGDVIRAKTQQELDDERAAKPPVPPSPIQILETENADLWYQVMIEKNRNDNHDSEIADIWYETMMGGA